MENKVSPDPIQIYSFLIGVVVKTKQKANPITLGLVFLVYKIPKENKGSELG